ncbi:MAG: heavy-metal-associated domain-containing protein [Intrasporangium sp.]|uniref:heavy-metal-associated domain-containing protein n=1 Tax=Intrasporangium sp. TaxID=1925024 RepID=UPI003F7FEB74
MSAAHPAAGVTTVHYRITGHACDRCRGALFSEVGKVDGVQAVAVDLTTGRLAVDATVPVDHKAIRAAIYDAGHDLQQ